MDGSIIARVPQKIPDKDIRRLIEENKLKLYKKYKEFAGADSRYGAPGKDVSGKTYFDGAVLPFVLGDLKLKFVEGRDKDFIKLRYQKNVDGSRTLFLETKGAEAKRIRDCIADWYKSYARETFQKKADFYGGKMGVDFGRISIREQKTRWGSCSGKGNLNFNWKLMMMPEAIIDYVVIHELAHRKHMDHSAAFWQEVEKNLPDYKGRRDWLKKNGRNYARY